MAQAARDAGQIVLNAEVLKGHLETLKQTQDEKEYRHLLGALADSIGYSGQTVVRNLVGASYDTIRRGREEMIAFGDGKADAAEDSARVREAGAGRKRAAKKYPELMSSLESSIYGSPENPLHWTTLSLNKISERLKERGIPVGKDVVARSLKELGYSRQQNQKYLQAGSYHEDRDAQVIYMNETVKEYLAGGVN